MSTTGRFKAFASFVGKASSFRTFFDKQKSPDKSIVEEPMTTSSTTVAVPCHVAAPHRVAASVAAAAAPVAAVAVAATNAIPSPSFARLSPEVAVEDEAWSETTVLELAQPMIAVAAVDSACAFGDEGDVLDLG